MTKTWVISDTHFGHVGVTKFLREDGSKLRSFESVEEMDEVMVENWNNVVSDKDRVYHLGDVVINRRALQTLSRLKGRKVLIKGNHDIFRLEDYLPYFDDIRAYVVKQVNGKRVIMSHIPIHPGSMGRWRLNIHGHLHNNFVTKDYINGSDTPKDETYDPLNETVQDKTYYNVSVERTNFRPILLDDILKERGLKN